MQHASDNWWVSGLVLLLSLIIIFKVLSAQGGNGLSRILLSIFLFCLIGVIIRDAVLVSMSIPVSDRTMMWLDHLGICLLPAVFIYLFLSKQVGSVPFIRRIPGLNAIDEAVGRATEMGRPVLMIPGPQGLQIENLQGLAIFGYIARAVARFGNKTILPTADPIFNGVAEETIRDAYTEAGRPELLEDGDVRYLTQQQFAYASGVAGIINRERPAASFMFGLFYAESLIFAETGQQIGAVQVAGTTETNQIPFLITACDYVIIGDEFYAASAYLSRNATLLGSIVGQDYCKLILGAIVILGFIGLTIANGFTIAHHAVPALLQKALSLFKS